MWCLPLTCIPGGALRSPSPAQPHQPRLRLSVCVVRSLSPACLQVLCRRPLPSRTLTQCWAVLVWSDGPSLPLLPPPASSSPAYSPPRSRALGSSSPCSSRLRFCLCSHRLVSLVSFLFFFFLAYSTCPLRLIHTWPLHCMEVSELVIFSPIFLASFFYFHYEVCHLLLLLFEHLAV